MTLRGGTTVNDVCDIAPSVERAIVVNKKLKRLIINLIIVIYLNMAYNLGITRVCCGSGVKQEPVVSQASGVSLTHFAGQRSEYSPRWSALVAAAED